jgi:hypothetical protein
MPVFELNTAARGCWEAHAPNTSRSTSENCLYLETKEYQACCGRTVEHSAACARNELARTCGSLQIVLKNNA